MSRTTRKKRLVYNTVVSLGDEIVAMLCGIILPRFFLEYYGSAVNGLVTSITQFLSFIAFLDLGVGAVVQSTLYRPLAEGNSRAISEVFSSATSFFRTIARIFIAYVAVLVVLYPLIIDNQFDFVFTATLIVAIAITQFSQYYFGIVNQLLLNAAQRNYIPMLLHIVVLLLNTGISILLMKIGCNIQIVKLVSSAIFFLRPLIMLIYVNRQFKIDHSVKYSEEPIKQKWNGLAQHIASVVLDNTDVAILTVFSHLEYASIYSVYYLIVHGIRKVIERFSTGMQSLLGDIYACNEQRKLQQVFQTFEYSIHLFVSFLFGCTGVLLLPFVLVYTLGINDVDYSRPLFGALLTLSQAVYCLRVPYMMMIKAAGHYKQTQRSAIIEVVINLSVSVVLVIQFGLVGIAIGTLMAMLYRTVYLALYTYSHFIDAKKRRLIKLFAIDALEVTLLVLLTNWIRIGELNYFSWCLMAFKIVAVASLIMIVVHLLLYRQELVNLINRMKKRKA